MIQRYLGTTVYGMWCKYVDTKSLPFNTLSRYHIKNRRTYGLTLSPYHIKKTTDQGDAPKILLEGEILLEEADFQPEFVDQNQEFRKILFLLVGNSCA
jgi:hypothetical protein